MGYIWSCRCAELPCCTSKARAHAQVEHERLVAALSAELAISKTQGAKEDLKTARALGRRALREVADASSQPNVFWFLPVEVLPDIFNPVSLGWKKAPRTCQMCCPCMVWCMNRLPAQKPLFLIQQMAADGRPYGCCHTRRDMRSDPTLQWVDLVRADAEANVLPWERKQRERKVLSYYSL